MQDNRLLKFSSSSNYKGFKQKGTMKESRNTGLIQTTLSDGKREFMGEGSGRDEALTDAFNKIDDYIEEPQEA